MRRRLPCAPQHPFSQERQRAEEKRGVEVVLVDEVCPEYDVERRAGRRNVGRLAPRQLPQPEARPRRHVLKVAGQVELGHVQHAVGERDLARPQRPGGQPDQAAAAPQLDHAFAGDELGPLGQRPRQKLPRLPDLPTRPPSHVAAPGFGLRGGGGRQGEG